MNNVVALIDLAVAAFFLPYDAARLDLPTCLPIYLLPGLLLLSLVATVSASQWVCFAKLPTFVFRLVILRNYAAGDVAILKRHSH